MPTRMKPMTGLIRKRAKAGMTIPAAPRITSASLRPEVPKSVRHLAFMPASGAMYRRAQWPMRNHRSPDRRRRSRRDDGGPAVRARRGARRSCSKSTTTSSAISAATPSIPRRCEIFHELGMLDELLARPHDKARAPERDHRRREGPDRGFQPPQGAGAVHRPDAAMGIPRLRRRSRAGAIPASRSG